MMRIQKGWIVRGVGGVAWFDIERQRSSGPFDDHDAVFRAKRAADDARKAGLDIDQIHAAFPSAGDELQNVPRGNGAHFLSDEHGLRVPAVRHLSWKVQSARDRTIRTFRIGVRSEFLESKEKEFFQNSGIFARKFKNFGKINFNIF